MAKSALAQLNASKEPHIVSPIPAGFPGASSASSMVVSTPREVYGLIQRVPYGKVVTLDEIRGYLARWHGAEIACPVSTAIFINLVARAAEEQAAQGATTITPYWRVLRKGGLLSEKYPGGEAAQQARLEAEGLSVAQRGQRLRVANYQAHLFIFP